MAQDTQEIAEREVVDGVDETASIGFRSLPLTSSMKGEDSSECDGDINGAMRGEGFHRCNCCVKTLLFTQLKLPRRLRETPGRIDQAQRGEHASSREGMQETKRRPYLYLHVVCF